MPLLIEPGQHANERKKIEAEKADLLHDLTERKKELKCLYVLDTLIEKPSIALEEMLTGVVDLISRAWHPHEITGVRIIFENKEYKTGEFKITRRKQSADIKVWSEKVGSIEVYYKKEQMAASKESFPKEKGSFANAVAGRLGRACERIRIEDLLHRQNEILKKKNIALRELLKQVEIEKKQLKNNIVSNAKNLLLPIIKKIGTNGKSSKYTALLKKNVYELTSSFSSKLTEKDAKLTTREIEICNMIKGGLSSKEIAGLLEVSLRTIEKHRLNIRNKLGIVKKNFNLTSYLRSL